MDLDFEGVRIGAQKKIWQRTIDLYIWRRGSGRSSQCFDGEKWCEIPEGWDATRSLVLDIPNAQVLMDSLWDCGIRPTEGNGSAGSMRATEKHLEDMRKIAFRFIECDKKD